MAITALDCPTRGSLGVCPECGRSVPDTCGKDDPRAEAPIGSPEPSTPAATNEQKAPEAPQEAAGESEASQATQVAEASTEATSEAPAQPVKTTTRKASSK